MKTIILTIIFSLIILSNAYSQGWTSQSSGLTTYIASVHFINSTTGFAGGNQGKILKTTNGGANWTQCTTGTSANLNSIQFIDVNTGWAAGSGAALVKTTNGGINWQSYSTGSSVGIFFSDANTGYGAGGDGTIIKTTNGGVNWTSQTSGTTEYLTDCYFVNNTTGWAAGFSGVILKTTNGGTNWASQTSGTGTEFFSLFFINSSTGWAVGGAGNMRRTTNSGTNWTGMTSPTDDDLLSVFFINSSTGWVSSSNGKMLATTNGGINWQFQAIPTSSSMNSVFFIGLNGWSSGTDGTIISTTTGGYAVGMPVLTSPANNSSGISLTPQLQWQSVSGATSYRLQLSTDSNFAATLINDSTLTTTSYTVQSGLLQNNVKYYWRVRAKNANGSGLYSDTWNFTTSLTGISKINSEIPGEYKLYNNYPNPFNPTTKIRFSLPNPSEGGAKVVKLIMYDITGKEAETLVNEELNPGSYEIQWNAFNYPSGIYFYRLTSGDYSDVKKMMLVK